MRFAICEFKTGDFLEEVDLEIAGDLTRFLKGYGEGSFLSPYTDGMGRVFPSRPWERLLVPGKNMVLVCDDDWSIIWAGYFIERQRGVKAAAAGFPARTVEDYFLRRYKGTSDHVGVDQATIFRQMVQEANVNGVGFEIDAPLTGVLRERHYSDTENARIGDRMTELSNVINGFDWRVDVEWRGTPGTGGVRKIVRLGYPYLGYRPERPEHEFRLGVNVTDALLTERWGDGDTATHVRAVGDGDGQNRLLSSPIIDTAREAAGWPRFELRRSYSGVTEVPTINDHARRLSAAFFGGQQVITLEARNPQPGERFTKLSEIQLGDSARVVIDSDGLTLDAVWPVTGWSLDPNLIVYRPTLADLKSEAVDLDG